MKSQSTDPRGLKHRIIKNAVIVASGLGVAGVAIGILGPSRPPEPSTPLVHHVAYREGGDGQGQPIDATLIKGGKEAGGNDVLGTATAIKVRRSPEFVEKGIGWLIKAQHPNGGWGAGSHAAQQVKDPHAVVVDPATTAFVVSALLRSGHTPVGGEFKAASRKATEYLCGAVEEYTKPGPKITDLTDTQIQSKLGPLVDTAMTAQYMARVLPLLPKEDPLRGRVDKALDKCLSKIHESQQKDGSWNVGGGWANVLQSSLNCSAMEYAQAAGKPVDKDKLQQARTYQLGNYDAKSGATKTESSAGVALYSFNSSLRANAAQTRAADEIIVEAKKSGALAPDAPLSVANLEKAGVKNEEAKQLVAASANVSAQLPILNGLATVSKPTAGPTASPTAGVAPTTATGTVLVASTPTSSFPASAASAAGPSATTATATGGVVLADADVIVSSFTRRVGRGGAPDLAATASPDEALLAGFGNNGGEEFLSYMLASESMVIMGEKDWAPWYDRMSGRLSKVQNPDGSWSGHHCITSPVFCTAAVVQTMLADRDAEMLARLAKEATALAKSDVKPDAKNGAK